MGMCSKRGLRGAGTWQASLEKPAVRSCLFAFRLFRERLSQLRLRLEEVGAERAPEYTEPLGGLQQSLKVRIQVAGV